MVFVDNGVMNGYRGRMREFLNGLIKRIEGSDQLISTMVGLVIVTVVMSAGYYGVFRNKFNLDWLEPRVEIITDQTESVYSQYRVLPGEGLSQIAEKLYGDPDLWQEIAKANNISDPNVIEVGTMLKISKATASPVATASTAEKNEFGDFIQQPKTYVVVRGDYLSRISTNVYGRADRGNDILEANRETIKNPSVLEEGMVLTIPE